MQVETIVAGFALLFGGGGIWLAFKWFFDDRKKTAISIDEQRVSQSATITNSALEMTRVQADQIKRLIERVNTQDGLLGQLRQDLDSLRGENQQLRVRINVLELSLSSWQVAWRERHPGEPFPVNSPPVLHD